MHDVTDHEGNEQFTTLDRDVEHVSADAVTVLSGTAQTVEAQTVTVKESAVGEITADTADVRESAVGKIAAASVQSKETGIGLVKADAVTVSDGGLFGACANEVHMERSKAAFLAAKSVTGDARVLLDWRAAAAFGAAMGLVLGLLRILIGRDGQDSQTLQGGDA